MDDHNNFRDVPGVLIGLTTLVATVVAAVFTFTVAWWWLILAVTAMCTGAVLVPKSLPVGDPERWGMPDRAFHAVFCVAVGGGSALSFAWSTWIPVIVGGAVAVFAVAISVELDKPKRMMRP